MGKHKEHATHLGQIHLAIHDAIFEMWKAQRFDGASDHERRILQRAEKMLHESAALVWEAERGICWSKERIAEVKQEDRERWEQQQREAQERR